MPDVAGTDSLTDDAKATLHQTIADNVRLALAGDWDAFALAASTKTR